MICLTHKITDRLEALHRLLQSAPYQTQAWRNESNGISATGSIPLKFNRPTLGGQFKPGVIQIAIRSSVFVRGVRPLAPVCASSLEVRTAAAWRGGIHISPEYEL